MDFFFFWKGLYRKGFIPRELCQAAEEGFALIIWASLLCGPTLLPLLSLRVPTQREGTLCSRTRWEEPMAGLVIYTARRGGCCLPSNTQKDRERGRERERKRRREGHAYAAGAEEERKGSVWTLAWPTTSRTPGGGHRGRSWRSRKLLCVAPNLQTSRCTQA